MQPAEIKRCLELYHGEPRFKSALDRGDRSVLEDWNLDLDPTRLQPLLHPESEATTEHGNDQALEAYQRHVDRQTAWVRRLSSRAATDNRAYRQWRARQITRLATQTPLEQWKASRYQPYAIELTRGCSVGCAYCALAAPPLSGVARFTRENQDLFTSVLDTLAAYFGEGADTGFLYWASEPFDNVDYERFLAAFRDCLGATPQTTTAAWHRDTTRTRRFIEATCRDAGHIDRFSINSLEQLHLCMREFGTDELENVLLVQQHPEASPSICAAGRGARVNPGGPIKTNSCVIGFLINLVDRTVALISPCNDPEHWPLGYAVYCSAHFADAGELAAFLHLCEETVMHEEFGDDLVVDLRDDFQVDAPSEGAMCLTNSSSRMTIEDECEQAILVSLNGGSTVSEVVDRLMPRFGPALVYHRLRRLRAYGVFEQVPAPERTSAQAS